MPLNNLGLGFLFSAKDLASGVMGEVKKNLLEVEGAGTHAGKGIKEAFEKFGTGLAVMGAGLEGLAMLSEKTEKAENFGQAMKLVTTRVTEAEFPLEEMKKQVNDLSAQFGIMPVDEATAMYEALGEGARDAVRAQALMTAGNQIAIGTNTDLHASIAAVSQVVKAFGLDFKDSTQVADSLFVASKHVEGGIAGMSMMLEHLSPSAKVANMTFDELLGTIMQLSAAGIQGRPAMSGLHNVIDSLISPSKEAKEEALRLGIAFHDAAGQTLPLNQVLGSIDASGRMNTHTLEKLFGSTEAATVAMALMKDGGAQLATSMDELGAATGAAAAAAEKMVKEENKFKAIKEQIDILIGEALLPLKEAFYGVLVKIGDAFRHLSPNLISFVTYLVSGVAGLAVIAGGAMAIAGAFALLSEGAAAAGITVGGLAAAIWAALWPVVLVAAVVGLAIWGLKVAFDKNLGGIADKAAEVWGDLKLTFTALSELFSGGGFSEDTWQQLEKHSGIRDFAISVYMWVGRIENFFKKFGEGFEEVIGRMGPIFRAIGAEVEKFAEQFGLMFGSDGAGGAETAFDTIGAAGKEMGEELSRVFGVIMVGVDLLVAAVNLIIAPVVSAWQVIKSLFSGIIDIFYGAAELVDGIAHGDWAKAWHGLKMIAFGVIDGVVGMLLSLVSTIGGVVDTIAGLFGKKTEWQKDILGFKDTLHNEMGKDFGVEDATGHRQVEGETAVVVPGSASEARAPVAAPTPGVYNQTDTPFAASLEPLRPFAAAGDNAAPDETPQLTEMTSHLEQIAKNTSESQPISLTVMMDSDLIAKAVAKAQKNDGTRNFTPAPVAD